MPIMIITMSAAKTPDMSIKFLLIMIYQPIPAPELVVPNIISTLIKPLQALAQPTLIPERTLENAAGK